MSFISWLPSTYLFQTSPLHNDIITANTTPVCHVSIIHKKLWRVGDL